MKKSLMGNFIFCAVFGSEIQNHSKEITEITEIQNHSKGLLLPVCSCDHRKKEPVKC